MILPFFFVSSMAVLLVTLAVNLALPPQKAQKFAFPLRLLLLSCIILGSWYDGWYRRQLNNGMLLALMLSVIVSTYFLVTDGIRYRKDREDPETAKSVLKDAPGFFGLLLCIGLFGLFVYYFVDLSL